MSIKLEREVYERLAKLEAEYKDLKAEHDLLVADMEDMVDTINTVKDVLNDHGK